jgi:tyrosyl-tRNA synthetase
MSKSLGNYIALSDTADNMFGKVMSVSDTLVYSYFMMCTDLDTQAISLLSKKAHPRTLKARLGVEIVKRYYGAVSAKKAEQRFNAVFTKKELPDDIPELRVKQKQLSVLELVFLTGIPKSKNEARRLVEQGAVAIDGSVKKDSAEKIVFHGGEVLKVGKRQFFRIKLTKI